MCSLMFNFFSSVDSSAPQRLFNVFSPFQTHRKLFCWNARSCLQFDAVNVTFSSTRRMGAASTGCFELKRQNEWNVWSTISTALIVYFMDGRVRTTRSREVHAESRNKLSHLRLSFGEVSIERSMKTPLRSMITSRGKQSLEAISNRH